MKPLTPVLLKPLPERPRVAVVMANFNYGHYVGRALDSLIGQTYPLWTAWVCDDGSSDRSAAVVESWARRDGRIHLLRQANAGMASALNTAFARAEGELVALVDSDDEWRAGRLEAVVRRFHERPEAGMVTHPVCAVRADGEILKPLHPRHLDEGWLAPAILEGREPGLPPCSGLTFRMEVARRVFPLPVRFRQCADKIAQDRAALITPVAAIREPLALYRQHGRNLTGLAGPVTLEQIERKFEFLGHLWADRQRIVEAIHGFRPDSRPWLERESAHLVLARRLLGGERRPEVGTGNLRRAAHRAAWLLMLGLPRPLGAALLRLWWTENTCKRFFRNSWDLVRPGGLRLDRGAS